MVGTVLICFGTRPEWLKVKPLTKTLVDYKLLFTGQHKDLLAEIEVDYKIDITEGVNRLDDVISSCLLQFPNDGYDSVMVHGDTVSSFACALAGFNRKKPVIHLEAGLRSYDLKQPYPEEGYRQMISRLADINLAPTDLSKSNLVGEKVNGKNYTVGNSVLDNLVNLKEEVTYGNKVLVTLHRWENHHWMDEWFNSINLLAQQNPDLEFIIPIHPNPNVQKHKRLLTNLTVVNPLPHSKLLEIMAESKLIISDSGGLQEEGAFFNKKVIVCRNVTERPEGIDTGHLYLCNSPAEIIELFNKLIINPTIDVPCPYGEGNTSIQVKNIFDDYSNT